MLPNLGAAAARRGQCLCRLAAHPASFFSGLAQQHHAPQPPLAPPPLSPRLPPPPRAAPPASPLALEQRMQAHLALAEGEAQRRPLGAPPSRAAAAALEGALECWAAAQAAPRAAQAGAASLALRAYGLLGAHRLAIALFRVLHGGRGVQLQREGLQACLRSAMLAGDSTAFLEVLEALEACGGGAEGAAHLALPPPAQQHSVEAARLESLLEAIVRGGGVEERAAPVLAALHALEWPLSFSVFSLVARAALAGGRVSTAAAAVRELARAQRSQGAPATDDEAQLAGLIVRRAIEGGSPEAAAVALYALRQLAGGAGSDGVARHLDLHWALQAAYPLGCVPLAEALAADALRHEGTREAIWATIWQQQQQQQQRSASGAAALPLPPADVQLAAVCARVLSQLAEAAGASGEDVLGMLRWLALRDLHVAPHVRRVPGGAGGAGGRGRGGGRCLLQQLPGALAPLASTEALAVAALRRCIATFFQWEDRLRLESGEEAGGGEAGAAPGQGAELGEAGAFDDAAGQAEQLALEEGGAGGGQQQQQQLLQQQGSAAAALLAEGGEGAATAAAAAAAAAAEEHLLHQVQPASAAYASVASLLGLSPAPFLPHSAAGEGSMGSGGSGAQQREVPELKALASGYTMVSFQVRLLALASAQAGRLFGEGGGGVSGGGGGGAAAEAAEAAADAAEAAPALAAAEAGAGQGAGGWEEPAASVPSGAAEGSPWGDFGDEPAPQAEQQQQQQQALQLEGAGDASSASAAQEPAQLPGWVHALAAAVDGSTLRVTAPLPSADPAAALPGLGGALPSLALRSLSFSAHLAALSEADVPTAPLAEGNLKINETMSQSLQEDPSGSGSSSDAPEAQLSPSALVVLLGAFSTSSRARQNCVRILVSAIKRFGCTYLPVDGFGHVLECLVGIATADSRREAHAEQMLGRRGGSAAAAAAGGADKGASSLPQVFPVDMETVGKVLQLLADSGAHGSGRVYSAVAHACMREGSSAKAAAVLRQALALGVTPPEAVFQWLLRDAISLHSAGLCPASKPSQGSFDSGSSSSGGSSSRGVKGARTLSAAVFKDCSLREIVEHERGRGALIESVQEAVDLYQQAGYYCDYQLPLA